MAKRDGDMVTRTVPVLGFVGDYLGNEASLVKLQPVFRHHRRWWLALGDNWTLDRAVRPLRANELEYVTKFHRPPLNTRLRIPVGCFIWMAGPELLRCCSSAHMLFDFKDELATWDSFDAGFLYTTGTAAGFLRFAALLYDTSKRAVTNLLFDRAQRWDRAYFLKDCFTVFSRSGYYEDPRDYLLTCALYFRSVHDRDRYDAVSQMAIGKRVFLTSSDFDDAVDETYDWHTLDFAQSDYPGAARELLRLETTPERPEGTGSHSPMTGNVPQAPNGEQPKSARSLRPRFLYHYTAAGGRGLRRADQPVTLPGDLPVVRLEPGEVLMRQWVSLDPDSSALGTNAPANVTSKEPADATR
jgi:hypothetical protein